MSELYTEQLQEHLRVFEKEDVYKRQSKGMWDKKLPKAFLNRT